MRRFETRTATAADDAIAAVAGSAGDDRPARFLAGGTTLVDLLKLDVETPGVLVDIRGLPLEELEDRSDGGLRIGSLVRNSRLATDPRVAANWPVLAEALLAGASPQIRNMATLGGNLMQRTRCPYFRDTGAACNKREPGSGCDALEGHHRSCAVLGTSDRCIATFPGDMPVALVALDAVVRTQRPDGDVRELPIDALHVAYGEDPAAEHTLEPGELITHVELPPTAWFARSGYRKARDRASYEFALASAAVALDLDGDVIRDARVGLGGVASKPWRSHAAEAVLRGAPATDETYRRAAAAALEEAQPRRDTAFKVELAQRVLRAELARVAVMEVSR